MNPSAQGDVPGDRPAVTPERIMQFAFGYAAPLMLEAAIRHRVFDLLEGGPRTVGELAAAAAVSERGLRLVLNGLVGLGLLARDGAGRYGLTAESDAFLVSSRPGYLGGMLRHTSSQLLPKWLHLTEVVRTGKPPVAINSEAEGTAFFQQFVEDLFPFNYAPAQKLAEALDVARANQPVEVLDLAAGSGVWGIALAQRWPQVRVTAVDWPGILPVTRKVAARHGLESRFRFLGGDLADVDFGVGYDVAILGHILHSEGERRSRALLRKTAAALKPGGTIAIAEFLVDDDRSGPVNGLIFAVNMLVNTAEGDTFSFNEIRSWLEDAGFRDARTLASPGPSPLILARR